MFESARYAKISRILHWLMAVMIALAYVAIEQRGLFERGSPARFAMVQTHFWLGICLFILVWERIALRIKHRTPPIVPSLPTWQALLSKVFHLALYAFFIVMPILGFLTAGYDGKSVMIPFTDMSLPSLVSENKDLAHQLEDLHGQIGEIFYWVIGFHIAAALYHHLICKDDTLKRML